MYLIFFFISSFIECYLFSLIGPIFTLEYGSMIKNDKKKYAIEFIRMNLQEDRKREVGI